MILSIGVFMNIAFCYNKTVEFKEWITKRYLEWRGDSFGNERSISEFARYLDVNQSLLSRWMSGVKIPGVINIAKISNLYPEVYDYIESIDNGLVVLPLDLALKIRKAQSETIKVLKDKGISINSPEGKEILIKTYSEFGITLNEIE